MLQLSDAASIMILARRHHAIICDRYRYDNARNRTLMLRTKRIKCRYERSEQCKYFYNSGRVFGHFAVEFAANRWLYLAQECFNSKSTFLFACNRHLKSVLFCKKEHDNEVFEKRAKVRVFGTIIVITQQVSMLEL